MFTGYGYDSDVKIEKREDIDRAYDFTFRKHNHAVYKIHIAIEDEISPFQKDDPFRLRDEKYADREWWLYEININGIMCYTYYQARNVLDVLTESRCKQ